MTKTKGAREKYEGARKKNKGACEKKKGLAKKYKGARQDHLGNFFIENFFVQGHPKIKPESKTLLGL